MRGLCAPRTAPGSGRSRQLVIGRVRFEAVCQLIDRLRPRSGRAEGAKAPTPVRVSQVVRGLCALRTRRSLRTGGANQWQAAPAHLYWVASQSFEVSRTAARGRRKNNGRAAHWALGSQFEYAIHLMARAKRRRRYHPLSNLSVVWTRTPARCASLAPLAGRVHVNVFYPV